MADPAARRPASTTSSSSSAADDVGGTWRDNTLPRLRAATSRSHLYSFSFAPNPDWSSHLLAAARDPATTCARVAERLRRPAAHVRFGTEVEARGLGRRRRGAGASRRSRGPLDRARAGRRAGRAAASRRSPTLPGLERFAGTTFHSAALGPRPRPDRRARRRRRHRRLGDPVRARRSSRRSRSCTSSSARRRGSCRAASGRSTAAERAPLPPRSRPRSALMRAGDLLGARGRSRCRCCDRAPGAADAAAGAGATCKRQVPDPELRAEADARLRAGLQAHPDLRRLPPGARRSRTSTSSPTGIAEVRERSIVTTDGAEHEVDTIIFGTGFHVTDMPIAERVARPRRPHARRRRWQDGMQAHRGTDGRRLPEPLPAARAEHRPRPHLGRVHDRGAGRLRRCRRCAHDARRRALDALEVRAEAQAALERRGRRRACRARCGPPAAARAGTSTTTGRNTTLWPDFVLPVRPRGAPLRPAELPRAPPRPRGRRRPGGRRAAGGGVSARARHRRGQRHRRRGRRASCARPVPGRRASTSRRRRRRPRRSTCATRPPSTPRWPRPSAASAGSTSSSTAPGSASRRAPGARPGEDALAVLDVNLAGPVAGHRGGAGAAARRPRPGGQRRLRPGAPHRPARDGVLHEQARRRRLLGRPAPRARRRADGEHGLPRLRPDADPRGGRGAGPRRSRGPSRPSASRTSRPRSSARRSGRRAATWRPRRARPSATRCWRRAPRRLVDRVSRARLRRLARSGHFAEGLGAELGARLRAS